MYLELDSRLKQSLFWGYILSCSLQAVLLHKTGSGNFNSSTIVLMQELIKLAFSIAVLRFRKGTWGSVAREIFDNKKFFVLYLLPALFYSLYNNLAFFGLKSFDPTTYFVLMQFRVVVVSFFSVIFLGKKISLNQWFGLLAVICGALCKIFDTSNLNPNSVGIILGEKFIPFLLVQFQLVLAASAGIYNEYLLKHAGGTSTTSTETHNIFMYCDSILVGLVSGTFSSASRTVSVDPLLMSFVVLNGATMGLLTAYFLRSLDSVRKSIASAIELWTTAILSSIMFGYPIGINAIVGLGIITVGVLFYSNTTWMSSQKSPMSSLVKKVD